jgi:hypothetical protein
MNYDQWVAEIANLTEVDSGDASFQATLPSAIDYGEQRLYRELDILNTVTRQTGTLTIGTRTFDLPTTPGRFVVTNGFNVITPASQIVPDNGTRNPLTPVSRDGMDFIWPGNTNAGVPQSFAMVTDQQILVGPSPDQSYTIECIGTIRPTPLSSSNPTTYLTLYLPDLWVSATMIFMAGWMQNFGQQSDNPALAVSYEAQYSKQIASANVEEQRKRYSSGAWGSLQPTPIATPSR